MKNLGIYRNPNPTLHQPVCVYEIERERERVKKRTWISSSNGGSGSKRARIGSIVLALKVTVESVGSVSLKRIGQKAKPIWLNGRTVSASSACIVERRLQRLLARVAPRHAPVGRRHRGGVEGGGGAEQKEKAHRSQCHGRCFFLEVVKLERECEEGE